MYYPSESPKERVLIIGASLQRGPRPVDEHLDDPLDELRRLAETAGAEVAGEAWQRLRRIDPATYIGRGKVEEIARLADECSVGSLLFDVDLSPAQSRSIQQTTKKHVVDRSGLIMDIFSRSARTSESRTQVELAQLQYMLPRLSGMWEHFSRHAGGIGLRGPGETQLETDRRLVRKRIAKLTVDLDKIRKQDAVRRRRRSRLFRVALVGYTNAGKSTLMNALTHAKVPVADRLFETLDSTVRRLYLHTGHTVLLSDTVGFIRNLPPHLIASFQSTLAEVREADYLLHVVDISHSHARDHIRAVNEVLEDMEIGDIPRMLVLNKADRLSDMELFESIACEHPDSLGLSAQKGMGIPKLLQHISDHFFKPDAHRESITDSGLET
jgi:GTPase